MGLSETATFLEQKATRRASQQLVDLKRAEQGLPPLYARKPPRPKRAKIEYEDLTSPKQAMAALTTLLVVILIGIACMIAFA